MLPLACFHDREDFDTVFDIKVFAITGRETGVTPGAWLGCLAGADSMIMKDFQVRADSIVFVITGGVTGGASGSACEGGWMAG